MATIMRRPRPTTPTQQDEEETGIAELVDAVIDGVAAHSASNNVATAAGYRDVIQLAKKYLVDTAGVSKMTGIKASTLTIYLGNARAGKVGATQMPLNELQFGPAPVWHVDTIKAWQESRVKKEKLDKS